MYVINARSLKKDIALSQLHVDLVANEVDICVVSETWFDDNISDEYSSIPEYRCFLCDRSGTNSLKTHGGGVCIYTHQDIWAKQIFHIDSQFETVFVHLKFDNKSILVCGMYVPPDFTTAQYTALGDWVTQRVDSFRHDNTQCVILCAGDCNQYPVTDLADQNGLDILRTASTRGSSVLDYCLTSHPYYYKAPQIVPAPFPTDHSVILVTPVCKSKNVTRLVYVRDKRHASMAKLNTLLSGLKFDHIYATCGSSLDECVSYLEQMLLGALNAACPCIRVKVRSKDPPYMTPIVKHLCRKKRNLIKSKRYREAEEVSRRIGICINQSVTHRARKGTRTWWSEINSVMGRRSTTAPLDFDVETLNSMFAAICTDPAYERPAKLQDLNPERGSLSLHQVYIALLSIKSTATGSDCIPWFVWSEYAHIFAPVMHRYWPIVGWVYPITFFVNWSNICQLQYCGKSARGNVQINQKCEMWYDLRLTCN